MTPKQEEGLTAVVAFLAYAEKSDPRMMFGSRTAEEAMNGIADVLQVPVAKLRFKMTGVAYPVGVGR